MLYAEEYLTIYFAKVSKTKVFYEVHIVDFFEKNDAPIGIGVSLVKNILLFELLTVIIVIACRL